MLFTQVLCMLSYIDIRERTARTGMIWRQATATWNSENTNHLFSCTSLDRTQKHVEVSAVHWYNKQNTKYRNYALCLQIMLLLSYRKNVMLVASCKGSCSIFFYFLCKQKLISPSSSQFLLHILINYKHEKFLCAYSIMYIMGVIKTRFK